MWYIFKPPHPGGDLHVQYTALRYIDELRRAKEALSRKEEELSNVTLSARYSGNVCHVANSLICALELQHLLDITVCVHYAFNREKEACCSLKLTAACSLLGQMKYLSDRTRTDLTGMLAYLFACIGKIMQICSEFDAKGVTQAHTHTHTHTHHKST